MNVRRVPIAIASALALALILPAIPASASSIRSHVLTITDMPAGWSVTHHPSKGVTKVPCLSGLNKAAHGAHESSAAFTKGGSR
jgi:hypothetical protein